MASVTVYCAGQVAEFIPGGSLPTILSTGTVIDSSQVAAVTAAATACGVTIVQGTPPVLSVLNPLDQLLTTTVKVTGTPVVGQTPVAVSSGEATWQEPAGSSMVAQIVDGGSP